MRLGVAEASLHFVGEVRARVDALMVVSTAIGTVLGVLERDRILLIERHLIAARDSL